MRILFTNHTGAVSGAERSLLDLAGHLPPGYEPIIASPLGPLPELARARGIRTEELVGIGASLRVSPREAPREIGRVLAAGRDTRRVARAVGADVIHANSIRAGLAAVAGPPLGRPPVVAHLRDTLPPSPITRATMLALSLGAAAVIGNSRYTTEAFVAMTRRRRRTYAIANPVDFDTFSPALVDRDAVRRALDLPQDAPVVGIVGQITPWKGQDTAIRAVAAARREVPGIVLLIVGEAKFTAAATRFDNPAYLAGLQDLIQSEGLADAVRFLGERDDVPAIMSALDILLVPSWEEPFGRVVVEGMAMGAAVVATDVGGPAEIIEDGVDGRLLAPRSPDAWAQALVDLSRDPGTRAKLTAAAQQRAGAFGTEAHVQAVVACYREILGLPD